MPDDPPVRLLTSEELFKLVTENVGELIAVLDTQGRRLFNSPPYGQILGDPTDLIGTDSFSDIHPDDRERVRNAFFETVQTGS